ILTSNPCKKLRRYPRQPDPGNAGVGKLKKGMKGSWRRSPYFFFFLVIFWDHREFILRICFVKHLVRTRPDFSSYSRCKLSSTFARRSAAFHIRQPLVIVCLSLLPSEDY